MICPVCGTQQRTSIQCVQCHTPFSSIKKTEEEKSGLPQIEPSQNKSLRSITSTPKEKEGGTVPYIAQKPIQQSASSRSPGHPVKKTLRPNPPIDSLLEVKMEDSVLISTTQRVEGKRIRRYFGLIHASVIINLSHEWTPSDEGHYQVQFKDGTTSVLNELKNEASVIGANAVVATTLDTHRIDSKAILLSAIGTAVFLEGPK